MVYVDDIVITSDDQEDIEANAFSNISKLKTWVGAIHFLGSRRLNHIHVSLFFKGHMHKMFWKRLRCLIINLLILLSTDRYVPDLVHTGI